MAYSAGGIGNSSVNLPLGAASWPRTAEFPAPASATALDCSPAILARLRGIGPPKDSDCAGEWRRVPGVAKSQPPPDEADFIGFHHVIMPPGGVGAAGQQAD